ncbi:MAG: hypothetical protein AD742_11085 [Methylibium sp. NZG]|nr:MAG: hypothetical protein AD742_11085 [Methylibium sp. NZG]
MVQRCLAGKQDAWRALVHRYQRLVFTVARRARLDEHAAADVLQTVFARLFEHLPGLSQPDRLHAWLVTTARRETLALLRHANRFASAPAAADEDGADAIAQIPDAAPLAEELLEDLQESQAVRLALDRLDPRCRDLLTMLFADEDERLGYDQISQRLGMPEGSIGPTRSRCLDKLRRLYLHKPHGGRTQ